MAKAASQTLTVDTNAFQDFGSHGVKLARVGGAMIVLIPDTPALRASAPKSKDKVTASGAIKPSTNRLLANTGGFTTVPGGGGLKLSVLAIVPDTAA